MQLTVLCCANESDCLIPQRGTFYLIYAKQGSFNIYAVDDILK